MLKVCFEMVEKKSARKKSLWRLVNGALRMMTQNVLMEQTLAHVKHTHARSTDFM